MVTTIGYKILQIILTQKSWDAILLILLCTIVTQQMISCQLHEHGTVYMSKSIHENYDCVVGNCVQSNLKS